ncbi:TPA: hypothetical protein ACH3X1_004371 [Trebouxia sp. C0004]
MHGWTRSKRCRVLRLLVSEECEYGNTIVRAGNTIVRAGKYAANLMANPTSGRRKRAPTFVGLMGGYDYTPHKGPAVWAELLIMNQGRNGQAEPSPLPAKTPA